MEGKGERAITALEKEAKRKTLRARTIENQARNSLMLNDLIHAGEGT